MSSPDQHTEQTKFENEDALANKEKARLETILQQVDNLITKESGGTKVIGPAVSYSKLYCIASGSEKFLMVCGWIFAALAGASRPTWVFLIADILDAFGPDEPKEDMIDIIRFSCGILALIAVFNLLTTYAYYVCLLIFAERVAFKTKVTYLEAILRQESAWYDLTSPQELSSRLNKEVVTIADALGEKMGTIILAFAQSLAGLAFAFIKGWSYSLSLLAIFPFILISTQMMTKVMQTGYVEKMKGYGQSAGHADQALNSIRVVSAFGQEEKEASMYYTYLEHSRQVGISNTMKTSFILAVFMFINLVAYAYSFYMGTLWVYRGFNNQLYDRPYTPGDILTCFFGIITGLQSLGIVAPNIKAISAGTAAAKMVYDIIDRVPAIQINAQNALTLDASGEIELKNITFVYPSRPDEKILKQFNLKFDKGKTTAIVGPSGSGKSTIVQLLERFYDPREGQVLIDGHDLKDINLKNYRQQIGYVGQEPVLFNTSVKENVRFGSPSATEDDIIEALRNANALDFVMSHEDGINMEVGQAGSQLSGGQKQRIAIARAFIKKPKILIFDEATSALDTKNEREVQLAIDQIKKQLGQVTTIVIAHRLTTIQRADTILVLRKGEIIERGNHESLLKEYPHGVYAKLVQLQENNEAESISFISEMDGLKESIEVRAEEGRDRHDVAGYDFESARKYKDDDIFLNLQTDNQLQEDHSNTPRNPLSPEEVVLDKSQEMRNYIAEVEQKQEAEDQERRELQKKQSLLSKISPFNKPVILIVAGLTFSLINGGVFPTFGVIMTKCIFAYFTDDLEVMKEEGYRWSLYMLITSLVCFMSVFVVRCSFGILGENITMKVRSALYTSILKQPIAWFDSKDNAPGVLTSILQNDASALSGASTEGLGVFIEAIIGFCVGTIIAFFFTWKLSLIALAMFPLMTFGGYVTINFTSGLSKHDEVAFKKADQLAGDTITNQRTVTSLGNEEVVCAKYKEFLMTPHLRTLRKSHFIGLIFGFSQFCIQSVFIILYWAGGEFIYRDDPENGDEAINGEDIVLATFAMMFAAHAVGSAMSFGPDIGKGKNNAKKVFAYIEEPSKINAVDPSEGSILVPEKLQGEIEFRKVWFRYPSRKADWVFKNLNLKISPNESIAIVGESGCGKSTLVNLLLRFYDVDSGEVLVDGVNVKEYDLRGLRKKMGLVMQEPTLFNYTIQENILYGDSDASNKKVREAAKIANALEFIESDELFESVENSASALIEVFQTKREEFTALIGEDQYSEKHKELEFLLKKERVEGQQGARRGIFDSRELKDTEELNSGFLADCGVKGGRLSGGQKQRIAIARAIVRQPQILILDEATSALDEVSQKKVQKALEVIMEDRTSIVIAHRLSTVEKCSRIVVLEEGRVVEDGSANELKTLKEGHFAKLQQQMLKQERKELHK